MTRFALSCCLIAFGAIAFGATPASSAGVRYVVVVNLTNERVTASFFQTGTSPVAKGPIESKRDYTFDMPPGSTEVTVTASACPGGKKLRLPTQEHVRVVVNTGCYLSIQ